MWHELWCNIRTTVKMFRLQWDKPNHFPIWKCLVRTKIDFNVSVDIIFFIHYTIGTLILNERNRTLVVPHISVLGIGLVDWITTHKDHFWTIHAIEHWNPLLFSKADITRLYYLLAISLVSTQHLPTLPWRCHRLSRSPIPPRSSSLQVHHPVFFCRRTCIVPC